MFQRIYCVGQVKFQTKWPDWQKHKSSRKPSRNELVVFRLKLFAFVLVFL